MGQLLSGRLVGDDGGETLLLHPTGRFHTLAKPLLSLRSLVLDGKPTQCQNSSSSSGGILHPVALLDSPVLHPRAVSKVGAPKTTKSGCFYV